MIHTYPLVSHKLDQPTSHPSLSPTFPWIPCHRGSIAAPRLTSTAQAINPNPAEPKVMISTIAVCMFVNVCLCSWSCHNHGHIYDTSRAPRGRPAETTALAFGVDSESRLAAKRRAP